MKNHKLEECKDNFKRLFDKFRIRFDDFLKIKPKFVLQIHSYLMLSMINCSILEPMVTELVAMRIKLMEFYVEIGLKRVHRFEFRIKC